MLTRHPRRVVVHAVPQNPKRKKNRVRAAVRAARQNPKKSRPLAAVPAVRKNLPNPLPVIAPAVRPNPRKRKSQVRAAARAARNNPRQPNEGVLTIPVAERLFFVNKPMLNRDLHV